ncbi:hypothetical protein ATR01nite_19260 [Acetobacter tropicalis]|uniref:Uncharacterized protein n=1 Tax=Acetobacter tropicalis TaxID=104102 RepID=A0A511FPG9_9PROT|nr:hypothetical protein ATR01nite_19260 [Acetobacter tropicalis]
MKNLRDSGQKTLPEHPQWFWERWLRGHYAKGSAILMGEKQVLHPDEQVSDPDTKGLCSAKGL